MVSLRYRCALLALCGTLSPPLLAQSILLDYRTATYGNPFAGQSSSGSNLFIRTLVTPNTISQPGAYEVLGRIDVYSRLFGSRRTAMRLLAEKAKSMGANAVIETTVWQAPAFPVPVAPHGTGIAVRILDRQILEQLADASSVWE